MRRTTPLTERFWSKVDKSGDCWLWTAGFFSNKGLKTYGSFWFEGASSRAHVMGYILQHGPVPEGLWVLHTCDVMACVKGDHLYAGTPADNSRDIHERNRVDSFGHSSSKFSPEQILAVRSAYTGKRGEIMALSREYGVDPYTIRKIVDGMSYRKVPA